MLGVGAELRAERAAHVRRDDPHLVRLESEHAGQRGLGALRALVRDPRGQPAVRPDRRGGARLHRGRGDAPVLDHLAGYDLAVLEQVRVEGAGVAERHDDVRARPPGTATRRSPPARHSCPRRRAGSRSRCRPVRSRPRPGTGARSRPPRPARRRSAPCPSRASGWTICLVHGRHRRLDRRHASGGKVGAGEHRHDPVGPPGGLGVNAGDPGVRDNRPDEVHVDRARQALVLHVLGVDRAGAQEAGIFRPHDSGAKYAHTRYLRTDRATLLL